MLLTNNQDAVTAMAGYIKKLALKVDCPYCGAEEDKRCLNGRLCGKGERLENPHPERRKAARRAFLDG